MVLFDFLFIRSNAQNTRYFPSPPPFHLGSIHLGWEKNFGLIEEDLYRSGHPNELNFPFLETLGLKTVVYLAQEEPSVKLYGFICGLVEGLNELIKS